MRIVNSENSLSSTRSIRKKLELKRSLFFLIELIVLFIATSCFKKNPELFSNQNRLMNGEWKFIRDSVVGAEKPNFDDSKWQSVDLPHDYSLMTLPGEESDEQVGPFSKKSPGTNATGHTLGGTGWYRKNFKLEDVDKGKTVVLKFDGVYMESDVWVNGTKVGSHKNGYTPFWYDITTLLNASNEPNLIAVKVENAGRNSRWYSGSGIYRNVHLIVRNPVHVAVWGAYITTPEVTTKLAKVDLQVTAENKLNRDVSAQVTINVKDNDGKVWASGNEEIVLNAQSNSILKTQLTVINPILWSVNSPNLYQAEIILKESGKVIDVYNQKFGIRSIQFTADKGFLLNGESVLLKGACLHHDNGFLGAAAFERAEYRRVELMKANGYNAIRCSHNAPSEVFLDACDKLGMLVINEFSDMWENHKNLDDYSRFFNEWWKKDLTDMMKRDRNHPSVIMWSIGNEIPNNGIEEGVRTGNMLVSRVKELDNTRPVTEAIPSFLIHGGWENTKDYFSILDVCGYNYMRQAYESDHEKYPSRVIFGSESFPGQAYDYWKVVEKNHYIIGDFVWSGMDYIGEVTIANTKYRKEKNTNAFQITNGIPRGVPASAVFDYLAHAESKWPAYISWCGDIDIIGEKKPQGLYRDVLWGNSLIEMNVHEPIPEGLIEDISLWGWPNEWPSWNWQGNEGKILQVRIFTKEPEVKLELNGKIVGEKLLTESDKYVAVFEVPYQEGKLTAIALENGKETARKELVTTGEPVAIKLTADRQIINADRDDLSFVKIEVVDKDEHVVPKDSVQLKITVTGNGELVASGNANPFDMKSMNRTVLSTYRGKAQAIIRPYKDKGIIKLSVSSRDLITGEIAIEVK